MKKETSSMKFWKCTIYCNFVSVKWNGKAYSFRKDGYDNQVGICKKWYGKSRNCLSFGESACLTPKERLFLMPYYIDGKRWLSHCFLSFGPCDKMGLRDMAIKVSRCQHGKKKKSPWLYSLEEFQGILPRIFPCRAIVGESQSEVRGLSFFDDG